MGVVKTKTTFSTTNENVTDPNAPILLSIDVEIPANLDSEEFYLLIDNKSTLTPIPVKFTTQN